MLVTIDHSHNLSFDSAQHANELTTLRTLRTGLLSIANSVHHAELPHQDYAKKFVGFSFGARSPEERSEQELVSCMFHWFAISACNYARVVGFIKNLENNTFTRRDLSDKTKFKDISKAVSDYVKSVPELADVLIWRNKVAGHFAITDPFRDDNIATLDLSVMFPVSIVNGVYTVGALGLFKSNSTGSHRSELPSWSLTTVFSNLIPRYWPEIVMKSSDPETQSSNSE